MENLIKSLKIKLLNKFLLITPLAFLIHCCDTNITPIVLDEINKVINFDSLNFG